MPRRAAPCRAALRCAVHHALLRSSTGRALRCRCWQGEHVGLGAVAVAVLVLYVVGYPLVTLIHVRSIVPKLDKSIRRRQRWHHFVLADYKASHRRFCWMASSARRSRIGMRALLSDAARHTDQGTGCTTCCTQQPGNARIAWCESHDGAMHVAFCTAVTRCTHWVRCRPISIGSAT